MEESELLMRVLVSGMTARQTKEDKTVAGMIAQCLREEGHEVTVDRPSLQSVLDNEQWDHVFVGLGPLHGIGTAHKYGALGLIGAHWGDNCTLYLDDTDSQKIGSGLRIMHKYNWKLVKPFYSYCKDYDIASVPKHHKWLLSVIEALLQANSDDHPRVLTPAHTYQTGIDCAKFVTPGSAYRVVPVDWSAMLPTLRSEQKEILDKYGETEEQLPEGDWWGTEADPKSRQIRAMGPYSWEINQVNGRTLDLLAKSTAYLSPYTNWTSRLYQTVAAGLPVASPWRLFREYIGASFEPLPSNIEDMTKLERKELSAAQYSEMTDFIPTKAELVRLVNACLYPYKNDGE